MSGGNNEPMEVTDGGDHSTHDNSNRDMTASQPATEAGRPADAGVAATSATTLANNMASAQPTQPTAGLDTQVNLAGTVSELLQLQREISHRKQVLVLVGKMVDSIKTTADTLVEIDCQQIQEVYPRNFLNSTFNEIFHSPGTQSRPQIVILKVLRKKRGK